MRISGETYGHFSAIFRLFDHIDGFGGTLFGANATALAIIQINLDGNSALYHALGTVEPADKA